MTDPQNDVPCRDCGRPTQHATEVCTDCRTPAGQLLTELAELGIKGDHVRSDDSETVVVGALLVDIYESGAFSINADGHYSEMAGHTARHAIAAIVDHAGTIASLAAERDTLAAEVKRLRFQRDKAAKWAGVDLSELDTMANEHGFTLPSEVPDAR